MDLCHRHVRERIPFRRAVQEVLVMIAPFEISDTLNLGLALFLGIFFGLSLERSGLGDPHRLTGVFYFQDFTVPKVMFTAIVVASTGIYLLADLHLLDLSRVWIIPTFFWPQLVGGLIFGVGFVVSGYCPGTSVAGLASGRLDALVTMAGISAGSLLFAVVYPVLEGFYLSSDMGVVTVPGLLGVNHWVVIIALFGMAAAMFLVLEKWESRKDA
jgi:uncharacterized membrane protein YedE/YeeE